jgi:PAS domain S-box-containing protein
MTPANILIVEDENITAELLQALLQNMGYTVCGVTAYGEEAVTKATELRPDLILMDVMLRGKMNGTVAAARIQEVQNTPIVYLTAYSDSETIDRVKLTQPLGYVQKPFRAGELFSAIEIALYRHRMEGELQERERSYRALADNLPGILYRLSPGDKRLQFFNDMSVEISGYTAEELDGGGICPMESIIVAQDREGVVADLRRVLSFKDPFQVEYRVRHKNGEIRNLSEHGRPICDDTGTIMYIDGMIFDITDRRSVEEKLRQAYRTLGERKTFFRNVINNIESGILVADSRLRITLANPYAWRFFNRTEDDIVGRHLVDLCPEIAEQIAAGIDAGEIAVNSGAGEVVVGFSRFNLKGTDRAVTGHIVNFKDLTEVVAIRREIRKKERLSNMGEVVARVAHEMRNPLFGMTAVGQILDMELTLEPAHRQLLDSLLREARRLNNLVEELLECTREVRIRRKNVDLLKIVEASVMVNEMLAREKHLRIDLVRPEGEVEVFADTEKVEQIMVNLLRNAIDASEAGGTILVAVTANDDLATVKVIDPGCGIPDDLLEKIFDVFYTTKKNGTGMGLAISRNIAEAHDGSLACVNNSNGGATFTLVLPRRERKP